MIKLYVGPLVAAGAVIVVVLHGAWILSSHGAHQQVKQQQQQQEPHHRFWSDLELLRGRAKLGGASSSLGAGAGSDSATGSPPPPPAEPPPPGDVWSLATPLPPRTPATQQALRALLPNGTLPALSRMCGQSLYRTLEKYVEVHGQDGHVFVNTGDIFAMWTRDSAVQMGAYLPRIRRRPWVRRLVEGAISALAFFILQDPWANAYNPSFKKPESLPRFERVLGRGGWVWNRNFELDSSAYFFNLLYNYAVTPGVWAPEQLLNSTLVHDAVVAMLQVLELEQDHANKSPYRYSELPFEGMGVPTGTDTGLLWTAFRPSDDLVQYPFNIPGNMYVAGALRRLELLDAQNWRDPYIAKTAHRLASDIRTGIGKWGVVEVKVDNNTKTRVYAYEVDGLGNHLHDFDDPNLPSLLSIPLLGYSAYDTEIYATTRRRLLSPLNPFFFAGSNLTGMGSPHTGPGRVWPLAHCTQALTTTNTSEQLSLLADLLVMASPEGLQHESVAVGSPSSFTRAEFGWAQAMLVAAVEQLLGVDCDEQAEMVRVEHIEKDIIAREKFDMNQAVFNKGTERAYYYNLLSAQVRYN